MPDRQIPMRLVLGRRLVRQIWNGQEIAVPTRKVIQNDPFVWSQILDLVDTGKEAHKNRRALVRQLRRKLDPIMEKSEGKDQPGTYELGNLVLSDEAAKFLRELVDTPPDIGQGQKLPYSGIYVETFEDFEDLWDQWRSEERSKETK